MEVNYDTTDLVYAIVMKLQLHKQITRKTMNPIYENKQKQKTTKHINNEKT